MFEDYDYDGNPLEIKPCEDFKCIHYYNKDCEGQCSPCHPCHEYSSGGEAPQ